MRHDYPKVMGRLSRFFVTVGWLGFLSSASVIIAYLGGIKGVAIGDSLRSFLIGIGCYTAHIILDFLVDLSDQLSYIEQTQQQQNKVLNELRRAAKETETFSS